MRLSTTDAKNHARAGTERAPHRVHCFRVVRIEKTDVLDGGRKQHWYRYVLDNGRSKIIGRRRGSLKEVTAHVNRFAEELNARRIGIRSVWSPRSKK